MKKVLLLIAILGVVPAAFAQKVDSIFFHLYTDSLKKGQHNYINVDGKMSNGSWQPLSGKEIDFSCSSARFHGNELIIPFDFKPEKVTVRAVLKSNPSIWKEITIWIKTLPDPPLPTKEEILKPKKKKDKN